MGLTWQLATTVAGATGGSPGQVLTTGGAANLSWGTPTGGPGGGTVGAGSAPQIAQYTGANTVTGSTMSGDVAIVAGGATTIQPQTVTHAKMVNVGANRLIGNPTGVAASRSEIPLGANLSFSAGALAAAGSVSSITFSSPLTGGTITGTGTVGLGNIPVSLLGSGGGTPSATTFLRGDNTWQPVGGGTPAGATGAVQYNNAGAFGGATGLVLNAAGTQVTTLNVGSDATGDTYYRAAGGFTRLAAGTVNYVLTSGGPGVAPSWQVAPGAGGGISGTATLNQLSVGTGSASVGPLGTLGTTTTVLHGNAAGLPTWGAVSLTADVSGILPVANGGSGNSAAGTVGGVHYFNTTTQLSSTAQGAAGTVLHGQGAAAPTWSAVSLTADVTGVLPTANGGVGAGTTGQLAWYSGTNTVTGNTHVSESGSLTTINYNAQTLPAPGANIAGATALQIGVAAGSQANLLIEGIGGAATLQFRRANGTLPSSLTTLNSGDPIASYGVHGYDGTAYSASAGSITVSADGAWSGTSHGTQMAFFVTAPNATAPPAASQLVLTGSQAIINYNGATMPASGLTGATPLQIGAGGGSQNNLLLDSFGAPSIYHFRATGTSANPPVAGSALTNTQTIGGLSAHGWDSAAYSGSQASINVNADAAWTAGNHGTYMTFWTTPTGGTTNTSQMLLRQGLVLGTMSTTLTNDMGAGTINAAAHYINGVQMGFAESVTWVGISPHRAIIYTNNTGRTVTITSITAQIEVSNTAATTINVAYQATTTTSVASGTTISTTALDMSLTTRQVTMFTGTQTIANGTRVGIVVTGTPTIDATAIASITVNMV